MSLGSVCTQYCYLESRAVGQVVPEERDAEESAEKENIIEACFTSRVWSAIIYIYMELPSGTGMSLR